MRSSVIQCDVTDHFPIFVDRIVAAGDLIKKNKSGSLSKLTQSF